MAEEVQGLIDGRRTRVPRGTSILDAARSLGVAIPTLCRHQGLPEEGACRLCLVEIWLSGSGDQGESETPGELVASCLYPLRADGFRVRTDSSRVRAARAYVLELLVNRCPSSPRLLALAYEYGVEPEARFSGDGDRCLRCGLCVRACEVLGFSAISLAGRGGDRRPTGPFFAPPEDCVGCLACGRICPTGAIAFQEKEGRRFIWDREFPLVPCPVCGDYFATAEELARGGPELQACPACRRRAVAEGLKRGLAALKDLKGGGAAM